MELSKFSLLESPGQARDAHFSEQGASDGHLSPWPSRAHLRSCEPSRRSRSTGKPSVHLTALSVAGVKGPPQQRGEASAHPCARQNPGAPPTFLHHAQERRALRERGAKHAPTGQSTPVSPAAGLPSVRADWPSLQDRAGVPAQVPSVLPIVRAGAGFPSFFLSMRSTCADDL